MRKAALACTEVQVLFYEAEGLLLTAGLLPTDSKDDDYIVILQLAYLGDGEISVNVGLEQCVESGGGPPAFATVDLLGAARGRMPSVWVTAVAVRDGQVNCRLLVSGEPGIDGTVCGQLVAEVSGQLPVLTASSRAYVRQGEQQALTGG